MKVLDSWLEGKLKDDKERYLYFRKETSLGDFFPEIEINSNARQRVIIEKVTL